MPNQNQVTSKFKTKQEIQQARKERDLAIANLKKQLAAAKIKEKEIKELAKTEQRKFWENERKLKAETMKEVTEQTKLIELNKKEIKEEKVKAKAEVKLKLSEIYNKRKEFRLENKRQIDAIKERVEAEKFEAKKRMEELKHKEMEHSLKLQESVEEQKVQAAEAAAEAEKIIEAKKRELLEQQELLRIKRAEAKAILMANKKKKLEDIKMEQIKIMAMEKAENDKLIQREYEIKTGQAIASIAAADELVKLSNESKERIEEANADLIKTINENKVFEENVTPTTSVIPEDEEQNKFAYDEKVFEFDNSISNTDEIKLAEAHVITSFGKLASKLYIKAQQEPTSAHNKIVQKRNESIFADTAEFTRTITEETPVSISSIIMAVNAVTKRYTFDEAKEFNWQFTAALLINQTIRFGDGYIIPSTIDGLRSAVYTKKAAMNEYAQFLDSEFESLLNEIVAEKLEDGAAILLSKNLLIKKHDDEIKVFANTPYLLA